LPDAVVTPRGGLSIRAVLGGAAGTLAAAGCDTPRLDAELLLASVLRVDRARLVLDSDRVLGAAALDAFDVLMVRRAAREPIAYILGHKEFRRIQVVVMPGVLIPRPETELLVEAALSLPAGARVVDVGTGSGAVALALKDERPDLEVTGTDITWQSIGIADANKKLLGLDITVRRADLLRRVDCDAVVANLPYVADGAELPPDVAEYEPPEALFGGPDGLDVIRRLLGMVDGIPFVGLEIGFDQADAVCELMADAGFGTVERLRDLAGHERVIVGRR
jgi:release factor glutamine methyltransferase